MTQQALAEALGLDTHASVSVWESGRNVPGGLRLVQIIRILRLRLDLLDGAVEQL